MKQEKSRKSQFTRSENLSKQALWLAGPREQARSLNVDTGRFPERRKQPLKTMDRFSSLKPQLLAGVGLAVITAAIYTAQFPIVYAGPETAPEKPAEKKSLSGADLYAIHCNRCHPERYATEFTAAQWKTIMIHMRVRANLPADQAREILKYLQQDSGQ